jgi:hypothetical protein
MKTDIYTFMKMSVCFFLSEKCVRQKVYKIKTHFLIKYFFLYSCALCDNMKKYDTARQATNGDKIWFMCLPCNLPKATIESHTETNKCINLFHCERGNVKAPEY